MIKPFLIGLTGSIGMGKSTTAQMFKEAGVPIWDADAAVHRLYSEGGAAVVPIGELCPAAVQEGYVDREKLKDWISAEPTALKQIEAVVHPLVAADRQNFIYSTSSEIVVLDIPLLFETGGDARVDVIVVVSTSPDRQRARVLERDTMSAEQFEAILEKQTPDTEKRARADFVIETDTLESARQQVHDILNSIRDRLAHA